MSTYITLHNLIRDAQQRAMAYAYCLLFLEAVMTSFMTSTMTSLAAADIKPIAQSLQLQCPPCEKLHCSPRNVKRLRCKGGITRGVCNCCPVCAKLEGELCGGQWNYLGKCDRGLRCDPESSFNNRYLKNVLLTPEEKKSRIPQGRCVKVLPHESDYNQMDQPVPAYCKPKCTAEYCTKNPRAICSAIDNAENTHSCQGDCQHTSCRACHFLKEDLGCGKCQQDDYDCIKKFGRCIKQSVCTRTKYPCRANLIEKSSKFQCIVPDCVAP